MLEEQYSQQLWSTVGVWRAGTQAEFRVRAEIWSHQCKDTNNANVVLLPSLTSSGSGYGENSFPEIRGKPQPVEGARHRAPSQKWELFFHFPTSISKQVMLRFSEVGKLQYSSQPLHSEVLSKTNKINREVKREPQAAPPPSTAIAGCSIQPSSCWLQQAQDTTLMVFSFCRKHQKSLPGHTVGKKHPS